MTSSRVSHYHNADRLVRATGNNGLAMTSSGNHDSRAATANRGNPSSMTSSEKAGGSRAAAAVTVQLPVNEERPPGSVLGDLRQLLAPTVDADRLSATSFQTLPRPNQDLSALDVDRRTGVVRATDVALDRESVCPSNSHQNESTDCTIDINIGLVHSLQLEQVKDYVT